MSVSSTTRRIFQATSERRRAYRSAMNWSTLPWRRSRPEPGPPPIAGARPKMFPEEWDRRLLGHRLLGVVVDTVFRPTVQVFVRCGVSAGFIVVLSTAAGLMSEDVSGDRPMPRDTKRDTKCRLPAIPMERADVREVPIVAGGGPCEQ